MYPKTLWQIVGFQLPVPQIGEVWWEFWTINSIKALLVGLAISWRHEKLGHGTCRWEKRLPWRHSGCLVTEAKKTISIWGNRKFAKHEEDLPRYELMNKVSLFFCWLCETPQTYRNPWILGKGCTRRRAVTTKPLTCDMKHEMLVGINP